MQLQQLQSPWQPLVMLPPLQQLFPHQDCQKGVGSGPEGLSLKREWRGIRALEESCSNIVGMPNVQLHMISFEDFIAARIASIAWGLTTLTDWSTSAQDCFTSVHSYPHYECCGRVQSSNSRWGLHCHYHAD